MQFNITSEMKEKKVGLILKAENEFEMGVATSIINECADVFLRHMRYKNQLNKDNLAKCGLAVNHLQALDGGKPDGPEAS